MLTAPEYKQLSIRSVMSVYWLAGLCPLCDICTGLH